MKAALERYDDLVWWAYSGRTSSRRGTKQVMSELDGTLAEPLLRIPPFPNSRPTAFATPLCANRTCAQVDEAIDAIRDARVGGTYWGSQPALPAGGFALVCVHDVNERTHVFARLGSGARVVCVGGPKLETRDGRIEWLRDCDPWHLIDKANEIFADAEDTISLIAAISGKPIWVPKRGAELVYEEPADRLEFIRRHSAFNFAYVDPFTGEPLALREAVELCCFWRRLIDSNRPIVAAIGFATWKRKTVAPLLWAGASNIRFLSAATKISSGGQVAIWKSRTAAAMLRQLQAKAAHLVEVEDGFIRSVGLGAECVPPLSIVVDRLGAYFDPSRESELERLIEQGGFSSALLERAQTLRKVIVNEGISKYGAAKTTIEPRGVSQRHLLVLGQVEDDRSVVSGGGAVGTNFELLRRVRDIAPDAFITYKPHPDVEAGHRVGSIPTQVARELADEIISDQPIGTLIDQADEVHVNTSLGGFEALLRDRQVVVHGVPFYAGWGLTRDLGPVPSRRTARRTLDELVAAVLLIYPRYLDPETGLPCPPEVLIRRLTNRTRPTGKSILVFLRRIQGRLKRRVNSFRKRRAA